MTSISGFQITIILNSFSTNYIILRNVENFQNLSFSRKIVGGGKYKIFWNIYFIIVESSNLTNYSIDM